MSLTITITVPATGSQWARLLRGLHPLIEPAALVLAEAAGIGLPARVALAALKAGTQITKL